MQLPMGCCWLALIFGVVLLRGDRHAADAADKPSVGHWAYRAPKLVAPPARPAGVVWPQRTAVDSFLQGQLPAVGLSPAKEASREVLLRRVTLDLTGLLPTLQEQADFLSDNSPDAFERVVDRLMASPHHAERMTVPWLDLARYADTHGYHSDSERQMWRYRDWVLGAMAKGMTFDQFTTEQLAGDLLPHPTLQQQIATGLQRNHMLNDENGVIDAEFLNEYICDRVSTLGTIWLGQTLGCARCHDHKYDPVSQKQFYQLYAFFHNVPENGVGGRNGNSPPWVVSPSDADHQKQLAMEREIATLQGELTKTRRAILQTLPEQIATLQDKARSRPLPPKDAVRTLSFDEGVETAAHEPVQLSDKHELVPGKVGRALLCDGEAWAKLPSLAWDRERPFTAAAWIFTTTSDEQVILSQAEVALEGRGVIWSLHQKHLRLSLRHEKQTNEIVVQSQQPLSPRKWHHVAVSYEGSSKASGVKLYVDGKSIDTEIVQDSLTAHILTDAPLRIAQFDDETRFRGMLDELQFFARPLSADEVALLAGIDPYLALLETPAEKRTREQNEQLEEYFLLQSPAYQELVAKVQLLEGKCRDIRNQSPTTMVMQELPQPRPTFVLDRGIYDKPLEQVSASAPQNWGQWQEDWPANRLGLAQWLMDPSNPLPARVMANRLWQQLFGMGLVRTPDDFGTRGEAPTHPELLDYLAVDLVSHHWDTRFVMRRIVQSHAYRQSSVRTASQESADPENRWLAVGPRYRLPAEMIRDVALQSSGLLVDQFGGPSVRPYQPGDLWKDLAYDTLNYGAQSFVQSRGAGLYRRSVYTFWKRTVPPPGLALLDAPNRETCTASRPVTNTPLQALLLLNDVTYVEAARGLAQRVVLAIPQPKGERAGHPSPEIVSKRLDVLYRMVLGRGILASEREILAQQIAQDHSEFTSDPAEAEKLLKTGNSAASAAIPPAELASWTLAASVILNLDEALCQH